MRTLERMSSTDSTDIQQMVASLLANRPYSHRQDVDEGVVAAVTLEHDMRFIEATLQAVLSQSVLPGLIIVADCTDSIGQPVQSSFEVIPSPSGLALRMPQSKRVTVQLVGVKAPRSFTDAMSQALKVAKVPTSMRCVWMLHDDSRPADEHCLETLLEAWRSAPTASLLGAKQLDWDAQALHNVGAYAAKHRIESLVVEGEPDQEQYDARRDVFSVSLAGALLPVATLRSLEGIDSWFGTFREGVDFCRRICLSGGRVVVVPKARIAHRRARFEGLRNREGHAIEDGRTENSALSRMAAQQRYCYTDRRLVLWPVIWLLSVFVSVAKAVWRLFNKQPYEAWCEICLPWLMWTGWTHAIRARRRVRRQSKVSLSRLSVLVVDRHQLAQWRDRRNALENQRNMVLLSPLAKAHLRVRMLRRWTAALAMAIVAGGFVIATNWEVFRSALSGGSLYSNTLLPTGASFQQLAEAATTPWAYGSATGMPAPPLPVAFGMDGCYTLHHWPYQRRAHCIILLGGAAECIIFLGLGGRIYPFGRGARDGWSVLGFAWHCLGAVCPGKCGDADGYGVSASRFRICLPCSGDVCYRRSCYSPRIGAICCCGGSVFCGCGHVGASIAAATYRVVCGIRDCCQKASCHVAAHTVACGIRACANHFERHPICSYGLLASALRRCHGVGYFRKCGTGEPWPWHHAHAGFWHSFGPQRRRLVSFGPMGMVDCRNIRYMCVGIPDRTCQILDGA
ncbi:regulatory protein [Bifidobacterium tsurumiense]|uniref:Regulatory protein n=1 Tax=Bifidobacterium tsurumiense TaxID=356829 RepID=A0A087EFF0_9BIFI|nr:regulatory protein [Bifidobacterium tsurumiense]